MNRVYLIGRLTKDPEVRVTGNGVSVVSFSLAVDNFGKDSNGNRRPTIFVPCVAWNTQAENLARYNQKGSTLGIDGKLTLKEYIRKDGSTHRYLEIYCENIQFLSKSKPNEESNLEDSALEEEIDFF